MSHPIIIIGSGLAGYLFAKEFRKLNTETPLHIITASDGAFYSKPLLSTALTNKKAAAELAVYDAAAMATQLNATIDTHTIVSAIDPIAQTITVNHKKCTYSQLMLACGSQPLRLSLSGNAVDQLQAVNDLQAYAHYQQWLIHKKHIAILGSGLVGCEFANDLINVGYQVDVISFDPYPLAKFVPAPMGHLLQQALAAKGVQWHLGQAVHAVNKQDHLYTLTLADQTQITAEGVFAAVGIRAETALAKAAGITVDRGIVVDSYLQTSAKHIYALGDCAQVKGELRQYVAPIMQCARVLAAHLQGKDDAVIYEPMPIIVKTPACPLVIVMPPAHITGEWQYEINGLDGRALFFDDQQRLCGFVLTAACTKERLVLTKQLMGYN